MGTDLGNKKVMAKNIQRFLDKTGTSRKELATAISVPYTTICGWLNAKTYPRIDKIEMMANYFGVQKKDLVEDISTLWNDAYSSMREEPSITGDNLVEEAKGILFKATDGATEEELLQTANYLNFLKKTRKE